jgi:hypothetical protein
LFLKMKIENSGFPKHILDIEDPNERVSAKLEYIMEYAQREGIKLCYPDIELNEAKRFIAKVRRFVSTLTVFVFRSS